MSPSSSMLTYEPDGVLLPETGLQKGDLEGIGPWLDRARDEVRDDLALWHAHMEKGIRLPDHKVPLDAGFLDLPERLLQEYAEKGKAEKGKESQLGKIQASAARLAEAVDRLVVLGIGGSYMGSRGFRGLAEPVLQRTAAQAPRRAAAHILRGQQR